MTQIMRWKLKYVSEIFFVQGDHSTRTKQEPGLIIFMYLYTKFHFNASVRGNEQKMNYDSKDVIKVGIVTENTRPVINLHSDNAPAFPSPSSTSNTKRISLKHLLQFVHFMT